MHVRGVRPGRSRDLLDMLGLCLSGLCLVHCIALPVALIVLPAMAISGHGAHHHWLHLALALVLVPIALGTVLPGYWRHRRIAVLVGGSLGVAAILLGALREAQFGAAAATALTIAGSVCLIYAHAINLIAGRKL